MSLESSQATGTTVGAKLRAARLAKKYTQNQLAQPDFSVSYISAIERGQIQPSLRALTILAHRLDLTSTDLLPPAGQSMLETVVIGTTTEESELLLLEAQIALHQDKPEQAIELLRAQLSQKHEAQMDCTIRYLLGRAYLEAGYLQESEQLLAEAARRARETTHPLYACILSLQNVIYTATYNTEQAAQLQQTCLAFLKHQQTSTENVFFLAQLSNSLGQHYTQPGHFAQALKMFQQALDTLARQSTIQQRLALLWNLTCFYKEHEAYQMAALYSYKWLEAASQNQFANLRSEIQHTLGHVLLKSNANDAYPYLLSAYQEARQQQNALSQASAAVHLASWSLTHDELDSADSSVSEARALAEPFGETRIAADALLLQAEIAYIRQEYTSGDACFESGLEMLEHLREEEELADHLARYARQLEERGLIHKAIIYWKRAYENHQQNWQ